MEKNKFIKSTFILIIAGMITKILGFIIKIMYTRMLSSDAINLYMLIIPAYSLFITIASLGLPIAISKLVAEKKYNNKKIVFSALSIVFILNFLLVFLIIILAPLISNVLLHNKDTYYLIICSSLVLPFISISSIIKGYFFGKQQMITHGVSNFIEQIVRFILIIIIIPRLIKYGIIVSVCGLIITSIFSEIASIITFVFFLPKNTKINKIDLYPDKKTIKDIFEISIPSVSSRFIGNIGFFLEPIILTFFLLKTGYSSNYFIKEYGTYNAYVIPTLLIPSFFINAISSALLPEISKFYSNKNIIMVKRRFKQALKISLVIGLIFTIFILIFSNNLLNIIYKTTKGSNYIRLLAPFFILFYLESPMTAFLQAIGKSNKVFIISTTGVIVKILILIIFSGLKFGIYSLLISEIINVIVIIILNIKTIKNVLN